MTQSFCPDRRIILAGAVAFSLMPLSVRASLKDGPKSVVSDAQKLGTGRFTYLGMTPFTVTLYAPEGQYTPDNPFAIQLIFQRKIKASRIVSVSVNEIKRQGFKDAAKLTEWRTQLESFMPTMEKGGDITGVRNAQGHAIFYLNGSQIGAIRDDQFSQYFFGIWLSEKSRSPALRRQLLGV